MPADARLGPVDRPAADRPYHPTYHPGHLAGLVGLRHRLAGRPGLPHPRRAVLGPEAEVPGQRRRLHLDLLARPLARRPSRRTRQYPRSTIVRYKFPAREGMPEVKLTWWDGGMMPPRPEELEEGRQMGDDDGGVLFLGDKGSLMCGCYGRSPRLIPESRMKEYKQPRQDDRPRIPGGADGHEKDWVRACKGGTGQLQLRLLRPAVGNGADGQPGRRFPKQTALGRREDGSHQRRGRQRLRPAAVPPRLDAVTNQRAARLSDLLSGPQRLLIPHAWQVSA